MRHGSTLRFLALCGLALAVAPARARAGGEGGAAWALPDESRGARVAPILLLSRPEVQADLRLRPDQAADADRVIADIFRKAAPLRGRTDAAAVEARRVVDDEQRLWLETKLTEDQVGRLGEIDLRWEGIAAIASRPAVAEALSLSDDQRAALARAVAARKAQRALPADRQRDPAAAERHFAQQAEAILNDGQRRHWERMLGRPVAAVAAAPGRATR